MKIPDECELVIADPVLLETVAFSGGAAEYVSPHAEHPKAAVDVTSKVMELAKLLMVSADGAPGELLDRIIEKIRTLVGDDDGEEFSAGVRERLGLEATDSDATVLAMVGALKTTFDQLSQAAEHRPPRLSETQAREVLRPFIGQGLLIDPDDPAHSRKPGMSVRRQEFDDMLSLAEMNPNIARRVMERRRATMLPLTQRLTGWMPQPNERAQTIAHACREYDSDDSVRRMTSARAFADLHLTEKGFEKLTDEEALTLRA